MSKELRIVVLAAGKGTRMNSNLPKVLHNFQGSSLIDYVLNECELLNPIETILVVGFKKEQVISHTSKRVNLKYVTQIEQLGTGHAVLQSEELLKNNNGHILILYGDVPNIKASTLHPIINNHIENNRGITLVTAELDNPVGYGRIIKDSSGNINKIVEEKDCSDQERLIKEINTGIFIFEIPKIFEILNNIKTNNASKEYYLTDAVELAKSSMEIKAIKIDNSDEIMGVNTIDQLRELES
jgi:UDP-N-acetylglucosamine diphosphorylase/glucosamine-1-phosphate N-acetyltransferase